MRQNRAGVEARRLLEFNAVLHAVKRNKARFIQRLQRRLSAEGECFIYRATTVDGYPQISLRYAGKHLCMKAQRLFLILKTGAQIPLGFDAGHFANCPSRACVRHIELQHHTENNRASAELTNRKKQERRAAKAAECPF